MSMLGSIRREIAFILTLLIGMLIAVSGQLFITGIGASSSSSSSSSNSKICVLKQGHGSGNLSADSNISSALLTLLFENKSGSSKSTIQYHCTFRDASSSNPPKAPKSSSSSDSSISSDSSSSSSS